MTHEPTLSTLLHAVEIAESFHRGQERKGIDPAPYLTHPVTVAKILADHGHDDDLVLLCAALLHDTVEDTPMTQGELEERFGKEIAGVVAEVTDDKSLPKETRKALQVEHAPHLSRRGKLVKLADKTANLRDLADEPPTGWSDERRLEYVEWACRVVEGLRGVDPALEGAFDDAAARARVASSEGDYS
jgi:guanosine-3',5'-bis(diphosphate) 3'-pyrophosphohydrolase